MYPVFFFENEPSKFSSHFNENDQKTSFFCARRSHLRRERKAKIEKARGKKGGKERKAKVALLV